MIAIIKYNAGNIRSVQNALDFLGYKSIITNKIEDLKNAKKVIFPGVGEAKTAMDSLKNDGLDEVIKNLKQPVLGICLGLQIMCQHTEECNVDGLGIFKTQVKKFPPKGIVPHMGWNNFKSIEGELFAGIQNENDVYFVHSYYAEICENTVATTNYLIDFSASLQKDNFYATQFHTEKSAQIGLKILNNFLKI